MFSPEVRDDFAAACPAHGITFLREAHSVTAEEPGLLEDSAPSHHDWTNVDT